ncbi:MAG: branched-chain amino acid ABC transporter permease [Spirochaetaceae bacterium]
MKLQEIRPAAVAFLRRHRLPLAILGSLALVAFPWVVRNQYFLRVATNVGIAVILASSLNIIIGFSGMFSLGHAAFYGIGAYTSALLATRLGMPFWIGLPAAAVVAGLFGTFIGFATLRLRAVFLAFTTLGFGEITRIVILNWRSFTRGPLGIAAIPIPSLFGWQFNREAYYYLILLLCALIITFIYRIYHSRLGRALVAIREDETAARSMGINVFGYKVLAFTIACCLAGVAGAFFAHFQRFVSADSFVSTESFEIITMVALGGTGSIAGPIMGAFILELFPEVFRFLAGYRQVIYGAVLITVIVLKPGGIAGVKGVFEKPTSAKKGWLARRLAPRGTSLGDLR